MANEHMKRYSTLLVIREMQIRTPMGYNFTPYDGYYKTKTQTRKQVLSIM